MSASKLEYELKCLNETLGTNLFLNRYGSGYVIFENGNGIDMEYCKYIMECEKEKEK